MVSSNGLQKSVRVSSDHAQPLRFHLKLAMDNFDRAYEEVLGGELGSSDHLIERHTFLVEAAKTLTESLQYTIDRRLELTTVMEMDHKISGTVSCEIRSSHDLPEENSPESLSYHC